MPKPRILYPKISVWADTSSLKKPIPKKPTMAQSAKKKPKLLSLSDYLDCIDVVNDGYQLKVSFIVRYNDGRTLKPTEVVKGFFPEIDEVSMKFIKEGVKLNGFNYGYQ